VLEPEFYESIIQVGGKNGKGVVIKSQMSQSGRKHRRQSGDFVVGGDEGVETDGEGGGQRGESVSVNREDLQRGGEHRREGGQAVATSVQNLQAWRELCREGMEKVRSDVQDSEGGQTGESRREAGEAVVFNLQNLQTGREAGGDFCETLVVQMEDRHLRQEAEPKIYSLSVQKGMEERGEERAEERQEMSAEMRIVLLQEMIERNLRVMNQEELRGAMYVLGPLSAYLLSKCTEGQEPAFNKVALVKTVEDLLEVAVEIDVNNGYATDGEDSE
jgi:hypothetical protein